MVEEGGRCALLGGERDGDDLGVEAAFALCCGGLEVGVERVGVLLFAGEGMFIGDEFGGHAHVLVVAGAPEAVVHHGVDGFGIAHAKAFARVGKKVRRVGHGLHAAGYGDLGITEGDGLGGETDGFETGAADHVDGESGDGVGEAAAEGCLAGGVLAEAGGENAAHDAFGYVRGLDAGALDGGADGDGAELDGGEVGEGSKKFSYGGACGTDDDYFSH